MKLLRVIGASGVLFCSAAIAHAETGTSPETSGAVTTPSGAETPAVTNPGTTATAPTAPMVPEAATPPAATNQDMALPPPPNGQTTEGVPVESPNPVVVPVVPVTPVAAVPVQDYDTGYHQPGVASKVGVGLLLGGGYQQFTNQNLRNETSQGGYWNVRIVEGTRQFVGFEAAYVGDARGLTGLGFSNDARLISNGLEGALRVNVPIVRGLALVEPFGFIGVGWQHYQVTNNNNSLADITAKDDILTMPFGGGLEFAYHGFMADARFTYRETYYNNLLGPNGGDLNNWNVGGQVGFEF